MGRSGDAGVELAGLPVGALGAIRLEALGAKIAGPDQQSGPLLRRQLGQSGELLVGFGILRRQLDGAAVGRHRLGPTPTGGQEVCTPQLCVAVGGIQPGGLGVELEGVVGSSPGQRRVCPGHEHCRIAARHQSLSHLQPVAILGSAQVRQTGALCGRHLLVGGGNPLDLPPEKVGGPARTLLQLLPGPDQLQSLDRLEILPGNFGRSLSWRPFSRIDVTWICWRRRIAAAPSRESASRIPSWL